MKTNGIAILLCTGVLSSFLGGCQNLKNDSDSVIEFELNDAVMVERGTEIRIPVNGVLGIPKVDHAPVVFILHGTHPVQDVKQDEYFSGFSYLAKTLAEAGFFAVAMNTNLAFINQPIEGDPLFRLRTIFMEYFRALQQANNGNQLFGIELKNKMDLTKLNFIGHSRGGNSSLYLSKYLQGHGKRVESVLMVAPVQFFNMKESYTDVPLGIVVPQYDGDVVGLDGYLFYHHALLDKTRTENVSVAFLLGGNHGWFNSKLGKDTLVSYENAEYITPETQRSFLSAYALDFLRFYNFHEGSFVETLGDPFVERHGIEAVMTLFAPNNLNLLGADISVKTSGGMTAQPVIESAVPEQDTAGPIVMPTLWGEKIPLLSLEWGTSEGSSIFSVNKQPADQAQYVLFTMALDPSKCNQASLTITATDESGNQVTKHVRSFDTMALRYYGGELISEGIDIPIWSTYSPLGTFAMDVSELKGAIHFIEMKGTSDQGAVMMHSVRLWTPVESAT